MANDLELFKDNANLPDYIKNVKSNLADATFKGTGNAKSISIEGGVWRLMNGTEQISKNENRSIEVVIVGMSESVGRTFYEGTYVKGKTSSPVCWSANGNTPDTTSAKPQSSSCDDCEQNIKGSGQGESKACRFIRYLAVVLAHDLSGEVYSLKVPATTMFGKKEGNNMPFDAYRKFLAGHSLPLDCVITELKFDTESSTPKLFFRPVRALQENEFETCQVHGKSKLVQSMVEIKFQPPKSDEEKAEAAKQFTTKKEEPKKQDDSVQDAEFVEAPVKRSSKKQEEALKETKSSDGDADDLTSIIDGWSSDD